jgi:hypothetical protein
MIEFKLYIVNHLFVSASKYGGETHTPPPPPFPAPLNAPRYLCKRKKRDHAARTSTPPPLVIFWMRVNPALMTF